MVLDYLIRNVTLPEFERLRENRAEIINSVKAGFNEVWEPRVKGVSTTFRYNPKRSMIGIYIGPDKEQMRLVIDGGGLSEEEAAVAGSMHRVLEERVDLYRLQNEEWKWIE